MPDRPTLTPAQERALRACLCGISTKDARRLLPANDARIVLVCLEVDGFVGFEPNTRLWRATDLGRRWLAEHGHGG